MHDTQGHLYSIRDLRIRFREPRPHVTSTSMIEQLLSETIHWSERGGINAKPGGPVIQTGSDVTPGTIGFTLAILTLFLFSLPFFFLSLFSLSHFLSFLPLSISN